MSIRYIEIFEGLDGVTGFFSLKDGASDGYPYDRRDVISDAGLGDAVPVWPKQIHGDRIEIVDRLPAEPLELAGTDGLLTDVSDVLLTTVHADCLPVYFFDPVRKAAGLVHAGWRGSAAGIAPKAAGMLAERFGCRLSDVHVYIGPGISRCCFETGSEVYEIFRTGWHFAGEFMEPDGNGKYHIDLKGINRRQLEDAGILPGNIQISTHCTCCEPELFCSYRREGGTYKRMGAGLCIR